jgi:hypothetical protein
VERAAGADTNWNTTLLLDGTTSTKPRVFCLDRET